MFLFYFCSWGMWDLSSPTRDRTHTICTGRWSLNPWTTREVSYQYHFWGCSFCRQTLMIIWNQLYTSDKPIWNPSSYYFQSFTHHPRPSLPWVLHAVLWHRVWHRFQLAPTDGGKWCKPSFGESYCVPCTHPHLLSWRPCGSPDSPWQWGRVWIPSRLLRLGREWKTQLRRGLEGQLFVLTV